MHAWNAKADFSQPDDYDADCRLQPLTEFESESRGGMGATEGETGLPFFLLEGKADWQPARSRETMTTRQPMLAGKPAFSQAEPDRTLSKG